VIDEQNINLTMKDQIICTQRKELDVYRNYANSVRHNSQRVGQPHIINPNTNGNRRGRSASANPATKTSFHTPRQSLTMFQGGTQAGPLRQPKVLQNLENLKPKRDIANNIATTTDFH
jgi:hypothetical protein